MPLSPPATRALQHSRAITIRGYQRTDGLFDIEAELVDTKSYDFPNLNRGQVKAGETLHGMSMRLTIDTDMLIQTCEAVTDHGPYEMCPTAAPNFAHLAGLKIGKGFMRAVQERVGGVHGCTHLRELLQQMATTAFQTVFPTLVRREAESKGEPLPAGDGYDRRVSDHFGGPSKILNTCLAYAQDGKLARQRWPDLDGG